MPQHTFAGTHEQSWNQGKSYIGNVQICTKCLFIQSCVCSQTQKSPQFRPQTCTVSTRTEAISWVCWLSCIKARATGSASFGRQSARFDFDIPEEQWQFYLESTLLTVFSCAFSESDAHAELSSSLVVVVPKFMSFEHRAMPRSANSRKRCIVLFRSVRSRFKRLPD